MIPTDMTRQPDRWGVWATEVRGGKPTKVPYRLDGYGADATDPAQWGEYVKAADLLKRKSRRYDGLAFRLGDGFGGVDIDNCRDPESGSLHPWAEDVIERLDSYTEVSPSGTGVKIFLVAEATDGMTAGRNTTAVPWDGKVELYTGKRYFTVTGNQIHRTGPIDNFAERTPELHELWLELFPPVIPTRPSSRPQRTLTGTDSEKLNEMLHSRKFRPLWEGDTSGHGGDDSAADQALCNHLRFHLGQDAGEIDRWFRMSGLMRAKWDEMHGQQTYGQLTISKALKGEVRRGDFMNGGVAL